ncbi:MAG: EAL domain-containing protein [Pseudomonadota bacterium]
MNRLNQQHALEQIRNTIFAIEDVTYLWSLADDQLNWSENLHRVLPNLLPGRTETGRGFASLLDHDNEQNRYDTVTATGEVDQGQGVPYQLEYKIWPQGVGKGEPLWLEDKGRWYASPEGNPGYAVGVVRIVNSRRAHEENLKFLSQYDPLTGMMNRACIIQGLGEAISAAERTGSSCSFLLAAMDNLDVINDAYGFDVADQVIASVSQRLRRHMRTGDSIGRYAGNKFALILCNCNDSALKVAAERFLQAVRQTVIETDKGPVWTTISMGGVVLPTHARQTYEAMSNAEDALSEAKNRPTDCFVAYKPSKRRASMRERNVSCTGEIVAALKQNRFVLAFQPIMDSATGQPAMYEALLRIAGQDGQVISAGHLLPIAEKLGLIRLIDRRVLEMGVAILKREPTLHLTINISGVTATDTRWFEMFVDYIAQNQQVAERLVVEITETVALSDLEEIVQFIERLRTYGCKVAIDDFGAGYTSFRNLQIMNIDMVKLDGAFCEDLAENPDNQYFVKTLVDIAKRFNVEIVAEWVQRQEDADLLRQWGVKYLQGHLFGVASIDPPWGRLEQNFGSDNAEHDPIQKVLHAGKPDLPGLQSGEGAPAPGEKWSAEIHIDRRTGSAPEAHVPAVNEPAAPAHRDPHTDPSQDATAVEVESQAVPAPQAAAEPVPYTAPAVAGTLAPAVPQSQGAGSDAQSFQSMLSEAFPASAGHEADPPVQPASAEPLRAPAAAEPVEPVSAAAEEPMPDAQPADTEAAPQDIPATPASFSDPFAAPDGPAYSDAQQGDTTAAIGPAPQSQPDAPPQAPNFEDPFGVGMAELGATAASLGRPATPTSSPEQWPSPAPLPEAAPEPEAALTDVAAWAQGTHGFGDLSELPIEAAVSTAPAPAGLESELTVADAPVQRSEPLTVPPALPEQQVASAALPQDQAAQQLADPSQSMAPVETKAMEQSAQPSAFAWLAPQTPAAAPQAAQMDGDGTISAPPSASAESHHEASENYPSSLPVGPQDAASASPVSAVQAPMHPQGTAAMSPAQTGAETVDTAPYNDMQPAPEYEPAQPSTNVVPDPAGGPASPFEGDAAAPAQAAALPAQAVPAVPSAGISPQGAPSQPPFAAAPARPAPPVQAAVHPAPVSDPFDPFEHMRPPEPPAADPDEFARKLQEALGPIADSG